MLDASKWMYIPLNLKVEFENLAVAYEKLNVKSENLNVVWIKVECGMQKSWIASANSNDKNKMQDGLCEVQCRMEHWILVEMECHRIVCVLLANQNRGNILNE